MADFELPKLYQGVNRPAADSPQNNPEYLELVKKIQSGDRGMKIFCPHCGGVGFIRTSKQLTKLVREVTCGCRSLVCGHTFIAHFEAIRTISPAAFPDPAVAAQLPQWAQAKRLHGGEPGSEAE
jgi:predicted RNA-binding Zn-ribbon protein involved in translation (DUF1610 family)